MYAKFVQNIFKKIN